MPTIVVPINYLAVLVASVASMAIGFVWFGPLFGKLWTKEMHITKDQMNKAKKQRMSGYSILFVGSLVMAYVLAHATIFASAYLKVTGVSAGVMTGFFNWIGFIAPVTLGMVLWDKKSWSLWILNNGYWVVSLVVMATILAVWR